MLRLPCQAVVDSCPSCVQMCAHQQLLQNYNLKDCPYLERATNFNNFHLSARHGDGLMVRHLQFEVEHCGLCDLGQCSQSLWVSISSSQWGLITFPISISIRIFTASLVKHFTGKDTKPKEVSGYVQDEAPGHSVCYPFDCISLDHLSHPPKGHIIFMPLLENNVWFWSSSSPGHPSMRYIITAS